MRASVCLSICVMTGTSTIKVNALYTTRHDTTRHNKTFFYSFDTLEFASSDNRAQGTKTDGDNVVWGRDKKYPACLLSALHVLACKCGGLLGTRNNGQSQWRTVSLSVLKYSIPHFITVIQTTRNLSSLLENTVSCMTYGTVSLMTVYIQTETGRRLRKK